MVKLIRKFLTSGIMDEGQWAATEYGVPQGGVVSPLFANIYLNELDRYMYANYTGLTRYEKTKRRRQGLSNYVYIRYADDWIIFCNGTYQQAIQMKTEIKEFLDDKLKIELSDEKTLVNDAKDGFNFLGYEFRRTMGQTGMKPKIFIPKKAQDLVRNKIAEATSPQTYHLNETEVVKKLNNTLRGWGNYYKCAANAGTSFCNIQTHAFWRYAHWLGRKYKIKRMGNILKPLSEGGRRVIAGKRTNPVRTLCGVKRRKGRAEVVKLYTMSNIQNRRLKLSCQKNNPYLQTPKP
jgi:hypothetical protein